MRTTGEVGPRGEMAKAVSAQLATPGVCCSAPSCREAYPLSLSDSLRGHCLRQHLHPQESWGIRCAAELVEVRYHPPSLLQSGTHAFSMRIVWVPIEEPLKVLHAARELFELNQ